MLGVEISPGEESMSQSLEEVRQFIVFYVVSGRAIHSSDHDGPESWLFDDYAGRLKIVLVEWCKFVVFYRFFYKDRRSSMRCSIGMSGTVEVVAMDFDEASISEVGFGY